MRLVVHLEGKGGREGRKDANGMVWYGYMTATNDPTTDDRRINTIE